jgi:Protein of unknown function (DUF4058)
MPSPFPGVDPYLENPEFWSEVHNRLIVATLAVSAKQRADNLSPHLRPKYRVAIEKRVYDSEESVLVGIADVAILPRATATPPQSTATLPARHKSPIQISVPIAEEIRESYLEIREIASGQVVTVIEILSPKNKRSGGGRTAYEKKRQQVLSSATHLVEIDLLRGGSQMPLLGTVPPTNYYILVSKADQRSVADLYPFRLQEEIPIFAVPLSAKEAEPEVDLQVLLNEVYDRASLDLARCFADTARVDYAEPPVPNLAPQDVTWADVLLKQLGLRTH